MTRWSDKYGKNTQEDKNMYDKLFSKGKINGCELRNRVIMSPMDDCLG